MITTMWVLSGKREVFLDVVTRLSRGGRLSLRQVDSESALLPRPGELSLVWAETPVTPIDLPVLIIGTRQCLEDFVAWANSYLRGIGTISSNCRLLLEEEISLLSAKGRYAKPTCSGALAGLVLAEVLALSEGAKSIGDVAVSACLSTFAFACARAEFLSHSPAARARLAERWEGAHRATNPTTTVSSDAVRNIVQTCGHILDFVVNRERASNGSELIAGPLSRLAKNGEISPALLLEVLAPFEKDGIDSHRLDSMFALTPTDRVRIFDDVSPMIRSDNDRSRAERAFAVAVLASACRPGTLQHFALLRSSREVMPEALLWFGAIQGLHRQNDVLESADGLGRRVLRELFRKESVLDEPRSDISWLELDILSRGSSLSALRTNSASYVSIEIAPAVYTVAKWRSTASARSNEEPQKELALMRDRDVTEELESTLRYALGLLGGIRRQSRDERKEDARRGRRWRK